MGISFFDIASDEDNEAKLILLHENGKKLAFLSLFSNGKFGY